MRPGEADVRKPPTICGPNLLALRPLIHHSAKVAHRARASSMQSLQRQVERQKQEANSKAKLWFFQRFSKKTQLLKEQDEEAAERARRARQELPRRHISAVANQQQARAEARAQEAAASSHRGKPQHQQSFLRQQLQEMKRAAADTILMNQQKRIAGEIVDDEDDDDSGADAGNLDDDDDDDDDEFGQYDDDDDNESVHTVEDLDHLMDDYASISSTKNRKSRSNSNRSSRASSQVDEAALSEEMNKHLTHAEKLYREAIGHLDYALHPEDTPQPQPEPKPLLLGVKKGPNRPKSEWI